MIGPITRTFSFFFDTGIIYRTLPRWWRRFIVLTFPVTIPLAWALAFLLIIPASLEIFILSFVRLLRNGWND